MGHLSVYRIILFSHHLPGECKIWICSCNSLCFVVVIES
jgi:hypothetical protein